MSAIAAKAMNSTIGTGEIVGLDILLKNAMLEVLQEDIQDRNKPKGLVAAGNMLETSGVVQNEDRYFYLGKDVGTSHSFTMKCSGSFAVAWSQAPTNRSFTIKKNGMTLYNGANYFVVSFKPGDSIQIEIGEGSTNSSLYIYAKEVDLRALF